MAIIEHKKAIKIERFFCNIRRMRIRATFNQYIFKHHGYSMSLSKLPRAISVNILSYLSKRENLSVISGVARRYRNYILEPSLWRHISLFANKDQANPFQPDHLFRGLIERSTQLKVLSLRYCQHVNEDTM